MAAKRILLVDDEPEFLRVMEFELKQAGYEVDKAYNGSEALAMLDHKPDLILADILMPVMDGYSLCRALQAEPRTRAIPFLFLSAKKAPEDKIEGMALGAHKYLTKPCSKDELLRAVDLRLKQSEESQKILSQRAKHVSGTLDRVSLYSLFELFYVGKWTGTIEMEQEGPRNSEGRPGGKRGVVHFKEGILEGAEVGEASADEALRTLLRWTAGTFKAERE